MKLNHREDATLTSINNAKAILPKVAKLLKDGGIKYNYVEAVVGPEGYKIDANLFIKFNTEVEFIKAKDLFTLCEIKISCDYASPDHWYIFIKYE